MPIKSQTEQKIRLAMERMLSANATQRNGRRLTLIDLAKEARVSRATLHRAGALCIEFQNRSLQVEKVPECACGCEERLRDLERQLEQMEQMEQTVQSQNKTIADLQESEEILAQQVQGLTVENEQLRTTAQHTRGNITDFPERG